GREQERQALRRGHHRLGAVGLDGGGLRLARQPENLTDHRVVGRGHTGRPADADDRGRELPRLRERGHGAGVDGADARAGSPLRHGTGRGRRDARRFLPAPADRLRRRGRLRGGVPRQGDDRRHRGVGPLVGTRVRGAPARSRRLVVRHLRRGVLPGQGDRGRRWRRHGDGGGDLSDAARLQGDDHPPPRSAPRLAHYAGARSQESEDCLGLGQRDRRDRRRQECQRRAATRRADRRGVGVAGGGRLRGDRPPPEHRDLQGPARHGRERLPDRQGTHRLQYPRRLHRGRRARSPLPPGDHRCGRGLHGGARRAGVHHRRDLDRLGDRRAEPGGGASGRGRRL
ncbi:MAG: Thioredoxin reductase, partial [uncultured Thermomicrobiales bacterium]